MNRVPHDSWAIIERVIRRYPESKREYESVLGTASGSPGFAERLGGGLPSSSPVESLVVKLSEPRMERLKREIEAVESAYGKLSAEHKKVIRVRFWSNRYRNVSYLRMSDSVGYKEAQMKRITGNFVKSVGKKLGEI